MVDGFDLNAFDWFKMMQGFHESTLKIVGFAWMKPRTVAAFAE